MSNENAITVENLSKIYKLYPHPFDVLMETMTRKVRHKEFAALNNLSFNVKKGQVVGIVGRNGAGKSTLLKIITGTLGASNGSVNVEGKISAMLELGTGFHPEFTGRENIYIGGMCLGLRRHEIDEGIEEIIAFSELGDFIDRPFKTYSSGMQARLTFATATAVNPDILIIDEALSVGDARFQRKSFARIERFRERDKTILLVSHDTNTIAEFCDEAILLEDGKIWSIGKPKEVLKEYHALLFGKKLVPDAQAASETNDPGSELSGQFENSDENFDIELASLGRNGRHVIEQYASSSHNPVERLSKIEIGNGHLRIIDAAILDEDYMPVNVLEAGRRYRIWMRFRCQHDLETAVPGVIVRTVKGVDIYGWDSQWSTQSVMENLVRGEEYDMALTINNNLANGEYFLTFAIAGKDTEKYDVRFDLLQFTSMGTERIYSTSIVNLGGHPLWQCSRTGTSDD